MPYGTATPTFGINTGVGFNYVGTGAVLALGIGFIPSKCEFYGGSQTWIWINGMAFGDARTATTSWTFGPNTACVLDQLNGSGRASANTGTTSSVIGLLIGTNTVVNGNVVPYFGYCWR